MTYMTRNRRYKIRKILYSVQLYFSYVVIVFSLIYILFSLKKMHTLASDDAATGIRVENYDSYAAYKMEDNFETIRLIRKNDEWQLLTADEKKSVICAVGYCEANYLGVRPGLGIVFSDDVEENVGAYYQESEHCITYNEKMLDKLTNSEAAKIILHEIRHAYQHEVAAVYSKLSPEERHLMCFRGVEEWLDNIRNYEHAETVGYAEYRKQVIEKDADKYATEAYVEIVQQIDMLEALKTMEE